jgi:hypothetical protein
MTVMRFRDAENPSVPLHSKARASITPGLLKK